MQLIAEILMIEFRGDDKLDFPFFLEISVPPPLAVALDLKLRICLSESNFEGEKQPLYWDGPAPVRRRRQMPQGRGATWRWWCAPARPPWPCWWRAER